MTFIFRCKTHDAYIIKNMIELLQNNIKTGCFDISKEGIKLRMMDANKRMLFDIFLEASKFYNYTYNHDLSVFYVGLNLNHLYKLLRTIKKKDSLHIFIKEQDISNLGIEIIPKDKSPPITVSYIKIQNIQNLEIILPEPYEYSLLITSNGFSKMCKDMVTISHTMMINMHTHYVKFLSNIGNIYSREITLGDTDSENDNDNAVLYIEEFDTEIFSRIVKIAGLNQNMYLHFSIDLPLLLKCNIGNLGQLAIYIKTKKQICSEINIDNSI